MRFIKVNTSPVDYGSIDIGEKVFSGEAILQKIMTVEAALAKVQGELDVIPKDAADEIVKKSDVKLLDEEEYEKHREATGHPLLGLIKAYKEICEGDAGQYIHYGTTTQDINDTALVLQMKDTYEIIEKKLSIIIENLREKVIKYKNLTMIGRTNDQQAVPITLGFKFASWLDELERDLDRILESKERVLVGQFGGAVGTMASLGDIGLEVKEKFVEELGLGSPKIAWYASRDRYAEFTNVLAILCCSLGRIGNEVYIGQKTEISELAEGFDPDKVGSSTMPHKRNPFVPARLSGYGRMARSIVVDSLLSMESTNERDTRTLRIEPYYLKRICCLVDGSLDTAIDLLENLEVHEDKIKRNLNYTKGLIYTEALMMRLSDEIGRLEAHDLLHELAQKSMNEDKDFKEVLLDNKTVSSNLSEKEIDDIMKPEKYVGLAEYFAETVAKKE